MNQNDPFAAVRAPRIERPEPVQSNLDPFAAVRAQKKSKDQEINDLEALQETSLEKYGKSALRGLGKAASSILESSAQHQEQASLPALLGMKPDVSFERTASRKIQENIPEESPEFLPAMFERGVEYAANPASWLGGPVGALSAGIAGATGKGLEKAGAPKWVQIAGELASTLVRPGPKKIYTDKSPEIKAAQNIMRSKGLTEEEVTLATNALKERKGLENAAKMYKSTEKQFESTKKSLEKSVNETLSESFPGFSKGIEEVEKRASQLFEPVNREAKQVVIMKPDKFTGKVDEIIADVRNTLANTPDENSFIQMLETAKNNAVAGRSADNYVNFYQTLNRIGKWVDPSKKESYMKEAKEAIKSTFRDNGAEGQKLAKNFDIANAGWVKLHQAEKVNKILENAYVNEVMDFKKLNTSLAKEKNYSVLKDAVGEEAAANLKLMSKIGESVERSAKSIEGSLGKEMFKFGKMASNVGALLTLNPAVIATAAGGSIGMETARYISTQLLTNPKYQNLWIRMADQVKNNNIPKAIIISEELIKLSEKKPQD